MKPFYLIAIILAVLVIIFGFAALKDNRNELNQNQITVTGSSEQKVMPDEGYIYFNIETKEKSAKEATEKNNKLYDSAKKGLESFNYVKFSTESYNINKESIWDYNTQRTIDTGMYIVSNRIRVTVNDVNKVGDIITSLTSSGVNQIESVSFGLSKTSEEDVRESLYKDAVFEAKNKAKNIIEATGSRMIDTPKSITINEYNAPVYYYNRSIEASAGKDSLDTEIIPKEQTVSVSLTLVYEYK